MTLRELLDVTADETWVEVCAPKLNRRVQLWNADYIGGDPDTESEVQGLLGLKVDDVSLVRKHDPHSPTRKDRVPVMVVYLNDEAYAKRIQEHDRIYIDAFNSVLNENEKEEKMKEEKMEEKKLEDTPIPNPFEEKDEGGRQVLQAYVECDGAAIPKIVMHPEDEPVPLTAVMLEGVTMEGSAEAPWTEEDAMVIANRISEACRKARDYDNEIPQRNALCTHLCDANEILGDTMLLMSEEAQIGCKAIYALLSRAKWFITSASKCLGLELD